MKNKCLLYEVEKYLAENLIVAVGEAAHTYKNSLSPLVESLDESFSAMLGRLIGATGKKNSDIYNRANIDRRLYFKIKSDKNYMPAKTTVLAFAIALELSLEQTEDLLRCAGFALSNSHKFDVIVKFFIQNRVYDIFEINEVLFHYNQPLLGGKA